MGTLFWPGDARAGEVFTDAALLDAMTAVEQAWLDTLAAAGIGTRTDLGATVTMADAAEIASAAEAGGNPVIPFLAVLRGRLPDQDAARWVHRGLTSQDVLDTALVLLARDAVGRIRGDLAVQVGSLVSLVEHHRATAMTGRTLTQAAVPITFGSKAAAWMHGVLDAADDLDALTFPAQFGGAAGNLSGPHAVAGGRTTATALVAAATNRLGLDARPPWHTSRAPVTRVGDAFVRCTDAWGRIANDVLTLSRPEIGELAEPAGEGRGGSSAMPQKHNPVLSVLIRRAALTSPSLCSLLHLAASDTRDERPDGAWHIEWQPLQLLARHTVSAASQTAELLTGLQVDEQRMAANLAAARPGVDSEQRILRELVGADSSGAPDEAIIHVALTRAHAWLEVSR